MIDSEAIKVAIAGGVLLATAGVALRHGVPRSDHGRRSRRRTLPQLSGAAAFAAAAVPADVLAGALRSGRPRIFTGEPAPAEARRHGSLRALKLIGGVAMLSLAGAFGLLVLVRAIVAMANGIGG